MVTTAFANFLAGRSTATLSVTPGVETPQRFSGAQREHLATRHAAGLFDFSFMGCIEITGAGSRDFLQSLQTRPLAGLSNGRIVYTLLLRDDASVLIDATLWALDRDHFWLFIGRRGDIDTISAAACDFDVTLIDTSRQHAVIAIQGAASRGIVERLFGPGPIPALPYYGFTRLKFAGTDCWFARIGYSGETGYELIIADAVAPALWNALLAAGKDRGLLECGFDAIDSLRIEAGHILFTRELAAPATPAVLGMTRYVDFYRPDFRGATALRAQRWRTPARRLVGLLPESYAPVDMTAPERLAPGSAVISSACRSPLFGKNLALGFVHADDAYSGAIVRLASGARATVARLPFYDPARALPRRAH